MKVEVRLFATLAAYLPPGATRDGVVLDLPAAATVDAAMRELGIPAGLECLRIVNGRDAEGGQPLHEGDVVTFCPPLVGG